MLDLSEAASDYDLIMIELTDCCNLDCEYCYRSKLKLKGKLISEEEFLYAVSTIKKNAAILLCGMGEQFVHPKIYDYIDILKDRSVQLVSNGTIKIDVNHLFAHNNIQSITFSVNGPTEKVMKQSCSGYKTDVLLSNLRDIHEADKCPMAINMVIGDSNIHLLKEMVDFCQDNHVGSLNLLLPTSNLLWVKNNLNEIAGVLEDVCRYVSEEEKNIQVNLPDTMYCQYNSHIVPYISAGGYVRPCCSHDKGVNVIGSIKTGDMASIIQSSKWESFVKNTDCSKCSMNRFQFPGIERLQGTAIKNERTGK